MIKDEAANLVLLDRRFDRQFSIYAALYLLALSIAFRLPFFFLDVINWDESTFILMGQSLLDGHLPYTELWDIKPPLAFFCYAIFIAIFGKSIVGIRVAGMLCVVAIAFVTYLIGKEIWNHVTGILGATLSVVLCSVFSSGQATMTGHIALLPLMAALYLLATHKASSKVTFVAGILLACASLIRLNLAYVTVIVGAFLLLEGLQRSPRNPLRPGAYAIGSSLVIALTALPYALTNNLQIWWSSVVLAPLSYADSQVSIAAAFKAQIDSIAASLLGESFSAVSALVWLASLAGFIAIVVQWKSFSQVKQRQLILLVLFFLSTELSILRTGETHGHYLLQLVPFMVLMAAGCLNLCFRGSMRWLILGVAILAIALSAQPTVEEYQAIAEIASAHKPLVHGSASEIAAFLTEENALDKPIYLMVDHIAYWFTNTKPLSKSTTHPSNIAKERLLPFIVGAETSTAIELAKVLAQEPKVIVTVENIGYLSDRLAAHTLLENRLQSNYTLVKKIEDRQIYRRL